MNMKKILAAVAASALSLTALAAMSSSAVESEIAYNGASEGAYKVEGADLRVNIYNVWGNQVEDIDPSVNANEAVKVTFTISGLGDQVTNLDEAGQPTDGYFAFLGGAIGANKARHSVAEAKAAGDTPVDITGDGQYTAVFNLEEGADTILCLYLQTNINVYNREGFDGDNENPGSTGIQIKIDSIKTDDGEEAPETPAATTTTAATTAKGDEAGAAGTTTTTAKAADKKTTTTAKKTEKPAPTGDAGVVTAVAALGAAAVVAFAVRKRK